MRYLQEISVTKKIACHEVIYGTINGIALEEASAVQHVFWFNIFLALNLGSTCKTNVKKMYTDFFVLKVKSENWACFIPSRGRYFIFIYNIFDLIMVINVTNYCFTGIHSIFIWYKLSKFFQKLLSFKTSKFNYKLFFSE